MSQFPIQNQPFHQQGQGQPNHWSSSPLDEPEGSKFDFWGLLNRRKWLIFLGTLIGAGVGFLVYHTTETSYESYAEVLIEPKNPYIATMGSTNDQVMPTTDSFTRRHDKIIKTKGFVEGVMTKKEYFKNMTSYANMDRGKAVGRALKDLDVKPDREEPNKFRLSFKAKDQDECKLFLHSIILTYQTKLEDAYSIETNQIARDFKNTTEKIERMLEKEQKAYEDLRKKYPSTVVSRYETIEQKRLKNLDDKIQRAYDSLNSKLAQQSSILNSLQSGISEAEIYWMLKNKRDVLTDEKDQTGRDQERRKMVLRDQISQLEIQKGTLLEHLGPGHPKVKNLTQQIDYYTQLLESDDIPRSAGLTDDQKIQNFLRILSFEISTLRAELKRLVPEFSKLKQMVNNIEEGKHLLERQDKRIDEFRAWVQDARTKLANIDPDQINQLTKTNKEGYRFSILANPDEGVPVWPRIEVLVPVFGFGGLLLGFVLGYLVDIADKTYRNPDEITKQLNIPLIGHIPVISSSKRNVVEDSYVHPLVCTYHRPKAQSSEAFRAVRTALFFNTQGNTHSVIQVTSPTPGDGKSTVAVNLAVSIAQAGKRVLLIDGDMRRPTVHHSFGIKSNDGFATILLGDCRIDDAIFDCEEIEGLSVMPCGKKPSNPAELITSPRFQSLIDEIREMFDFVIIDTPPILAVTDPCPVAARVDGVILTLRIKKNIKISSDRATNILQNVGANVIGVVVNGVGANTGYGSQYSYGAYRAGYSYNGYGYGYGYGYGNYYDERKPEERETPNGAPRPEPQRITHEIPTAESISKPSKNQGDDLDLDLDDLP